MHNYMRGQRFRYHEYMSFASIMQQKLDLRLSLRISVVIYLEILILLFVFNMYL